jgi:hypothetical protein
VRRLRRYIGFGFRNRIGLELFGGDKLGRRRATTILQPAALAMPSQVKYCKNSLKIATVNPGAICVTLTTSIIYDAAAGGRGGQVLKERLRKLWMEAVVDGFRDDLELDSLVRFASPRAFSAVQEPSLMLVDSLASGAEVFSNSDGSRARMSRIGATLTWEPYVNVQMSRYP